jgi:hypothetical protein
MTVFSSTLVGIQEQWKKQEHIISFEICSTRFEYSFDMFSTRYECSFDIFSLVSSVV